MFVYILYQSRSAGFPSFFESDQSKSCVDRAPPPSTAPPGLSMELENWSFYKIWYLWQCLSEAFDSRI